MTVAAHNPRIFIAYAPRAGLRCALAYLEDERDVYGWYAGPGRSGSIARRYFVLEDYHSTRRTRYIAVGDDGLHTRWIADEARSHVLAELQDAFVHEWLFHRGDDDWPRQAALYGADELALGEANVKHERLARLSKDQPTWLYASPGFEPGVLHFLSGRWPLDYASRAREGALSR